MTLSSLPPAVIFDWDNTLINTLPLIADANNLIRRKFGLPEWTMDEVHASTQHVGREGLQRHYGEHWQEAEEIFYGHIRKHHLDALQVMDGATDLLDWLQGQGVPLGIVSNKRGGYLRAEVGQLGWLDRFGTILGPDDAGGAGKPKPDGVLMAVRALEVAQAHSAAVWYAGDTENDLKTAAAAGVVPVYIDNVIFPQPLALHAEKPTFSFKGCRDCLDYLMASVNVSANNNKTKK